MDHLGIDKFMVLGFCIGGPLIWNLLKRAPDRVVAAVLAQPSGSRPEMRDLFYDNNMKGWAPELVKRRPDITMEQVEKFLTKMYRTNPDFVFTVTRDFVRQCQTPVLILPDDIPAHPYAVAMEARCWRRTRRSACSRGRSRRSGFRWRCARYDRSSARTGRRGTQQLVGWDGAKRYPSQARSCFGRWASVRSTHPTSGLPSSPLRPAETHAVIRPAIAVREHAADRMITLHVHAHRVVIPQIVADVEVDAFAHDQQPVAVDVDVFQVLHSIANGASASRGTAILCRGRQFQPR